MTRVLAATVILFVPILSQSTHEFRVLEPNTMVQSTLSPGGLQSFLLRLRSGDAIDVTVEQRGVDVSARLQAPDGSILVHVQDELRTRGQEQVTAVAETTGEYTLAVMHGTAGTPAGHFAIRLGSLRAATPADRTLFEASALRTASEHLSVKLNFQEAIPLLRRALTIAEQLKGPDDLFVARLARELGGTYLEKRSYAEAEPLIVRGLTVMERELGADHPATAYAWTRLGTLYDRMGRRQKAESLIQRATDVMEKTLGPNHPMVAHCLVSLANLRLGAGDFDQAEALNRRGLAIVERTDGPDSRLAADLLNNLGRVYLERYDYARADELFRRSVSIGERLYGQDSYWVATGLNNLGIIARHRKDYDQAERYYLRALAIHEKEVGPDHPDIASHLHNLAIVYNNRGNVARALETHFRALQIRERSIGPYALPTFASLGNIARTYAAAGDLARALEFQQRADTVLEVQLTLNLAVGSERQKLAFAEVVSERTDRTLSLNVNASPLSPGASALAARVLLQRKGRVLDSMTDTLGRLRERAPVAGDRNLLDELKATTAQLARLALNGSQDLSSSEYQKAIKDLESRKERVEATISEHIAEFRAQARPVTIEAVQGAIPDEAVLLEFAVFRPFDPAAASNSEAYGAPRYVAYVIGSRGVPRGIDLGPADRVDDAVEALRGALRDPKRADVARLARTVDRLVLEPLRASLAGVTRLLISPDGALNLIPFEALVDANGRFAVEQYAISYLTSGRDLLRMQVPRESHSGPVVVADPHFGELATTAGVRTAAGRSPRAVRRRSVTSGTGLSGLYFAPLAGTAQEARAIHALLPDLTLLTRGQATKAALGRLDAPSILHIASHGFFLRDAPTASATSATARGTAAEVPITNPLLRSGLALAGANVDKSTSVLTALEASNLNLWGTKLVTLSACDTGVGQVRNGEGVYGLRRSFVLAGAETLVMSLWPISDYVTREVMTRYYTGLTGGLGRGDALRRAQLAMLSRQNRRHPFYWASFIQAGDWRPLAAVSTGR